MAIDSLEIFGDSKLIINQVKKIYQAKQPRLKQSKNEVWDLVDNFFLAFNISFILREENQKEDSLALAASTFKPPIGSNIKYQVEVRHRTTIPDNIKH
jgi:ribonuclease HI